jgi:hypothetical protein
MRSILITEEVKVKFSVTGERRIYKTLLHLSDEGFKVKVKRNGETANMSVVAHAGNMTQVYNIYQIYQP